MHEDFAPAKAPELIIPCNPLPLTPFGCSKWGSDCAHQVMGLISFARAGAYESGHPAMVQYPVTSPINPRGLANIRKDTSPFSAGLLEQVSMEEACF